MKAVFLEGIPKHWCFLWCCPAQALKQSVELHPMTFLHRGSFVRGLRPIPARVWISFSLSQKNLLNKQSICSRFTIKALFLEGILEHWCFLWCWPAQALKQSVEFHPMKFYIEGRGNQVHSPHNDAVWISYSFVVNLKNLLNKRPNCSRFTTKAVFWKGY